MLYIYEIDFEEIIVQHTMKLTLNKYARTVKLKLKRANIEIMEIRTKQYFTQLFDFSASDRHTRV